MASPCSAGGDSPSQIQRAAGSQEPAGSVPGGAGFLPHPYPGRATPSVWFPETTDFVKDSSKKRKCGKVASAELCRLPALPQSISAITPWGQQQHLTLCKISKAWAMQLWLRTDMASTGRLSTEGSVQKAGRKHYPGPTLLLTFVLLVTKPTLLLQHLLQQCEDIDRSDRCPR